MGNAPKRIWPWLCTSSRHDYALEVDLDVKNNRSHKKHIGTDRHEELLSAADVLADEVMVMFSATEVLDYITASKNVRHALTTYQQAKEKLK